MKMSLLPPAGFEALIFDLDGTLADTMPLHLTSWRQTGDHFGVPIQDHMINELAGTPTLEVMEILNKRYGWTVDPKAVYEMKNDLYAALKVAAGKTLPIQAVVDIADSYRSKLPMAIGTGSTREDAVSAIDDLGFGSWFKALVTADEVVNGKPHPETYLKCAEALQIDPSLCFVYEDGPMGILSALKAGMSALNIVSGEFHRP